MLGEAGEGFEICCAATKRLIVSDDGDSEVILSLSRTPVAALIRAASCTQKRPGNEVAVERRVSGQ